MLLAATFAAPDAAASEAIPPSIYSVDPASTVVNFSVRQFVLGRLTGKFVEPTGTLIVEPGDTDRARIDISFPVDHLTTGKSSADRFLRGSTMFDAGKFPAARFRASNVPVYSRTASIAGSLTLHGVTHPVTLAAELSGIRIDRHNATLLSFTGKMTIRRSDFGMGFGRPLVSDQVDLNIAATFVQPGTTAATGTS